MGATVEIGSLITRMPEIRGGRPRIAGTGVTVRRIVGWYKLGLTPEEILEFAASQSRALYSYNVADFYRLQTAWLTGSRSHAGLTLGQQQQFSIGEQLRRLLKWISARWAEEMMNGVEFLSSWSGADQL